MSWEPWLVSEVTVTTVDLSKESKKLTCPHGRTDINLCPHCISHDDSPEHHSSIRSVSIDDIV